jgi:hypothetical protein
MISLDDVWSKFKHFPDISQTFPRTFCSTEAIGTEFYMKCRISQDWSNWRTVMGSFFRAG